MRDDEGEEEEGEGEERSEEKGSGSGENVLSDDLCRFFVVLVKVVV